MITCVKFSYLNGALGILEESSPVKGDRRLLKGGLLSGPVTDTSDDAN